MELKEAGKGQMQRKRSVQRRRESDSDGRVRSRGEGAECEVTTSDLRVTAPSRRSRAAMFGGQSEDILLSGGLAAGRGGGREGGRKEAECKSKSFKAQTSCQRFAKSGRLINKFLGDTFFFPMQSSPKTQPLISSMTLN